MAKAENSSSKKPNKNRFVYFGARVYFQVVNAAYGQIGAAALSRLFPPEMSDSLRTKPYQGRFIEEKYLRGHYCRLVLSCEPLPDSAQGKKRESSYWNEYKFGRSLPSLTSRDPNRPTVIARVEKEKPGTLPWVITPFWWLFEKEMKSKEGLVSLVRRMPVPCQEKLLLVPSEPVQPYLFQPLIEEDIFKFALLGGPWGLGGLACIAGILDMKDEYLKLTAFIAMASVLRQMKRSSAFNGRFDELYKSFCDEAQKQWYAHPYQGAQKIEVSEDALLGFTLRLRKYANRQREHKNAWKAADLLISEARAKSEQHAAAIRSLRGADITELVHDEWLPDLLSKNT